MSLVTTVATEGLIPDVGVGVYVLRTPGQPRVRGNTVLTVGLICAAPWGTPEEWVTLTRESELVSTFAPFGWTASAIAEAFNLPWGPLKFWNVRGTSPVAAAVTLDDGASADSLTITAKRTGTNGNRIKYAVTANGTTSTSRDVRIYVEGPDGTIMWDETYLAVQVSNGDVTDPGDPWVTMSKASGATDEAAVASGTLSGGTEGTIAAADYRQAMDAAGGDAGIDILVCLGVPDALIDGVRATMATWAATSAAEPVAVAILPTPEATAVATAITEIASYRHRKLRACYPRIRRTFTYSYRGYTSTATSGMDGAAILACIIQNATPLKAAFQAAADEVAPAALAPILAMETGYAGLTTSEHNSLMAAGINGWYKSKSFNKFLPFCGVTTYLDSSGLPVRDHEERYYHYVTAALARAAEARAGQPLDVDLANERLGPSSGALIDAFTAFFQGELAAGRVIAGLNSNGTTSPAFQIDAFSEATSGNLAAGRHDVVVAYRQTPNTERVVLRVTAGTSVNIVRI
jgi:hypothetical protein